MKRAIFGALLVAACGFAQAADNKPPTQSGTCEQLGAAVEDGVMELTFIRVDGVTDNSAARETNRQLQKVVVTNLMQMHLTLMAANKCPLPKTTFSDGAYYLDALNCSTALLKAKQSDKDMPPECDRRKWVRMGQR